MNICGCLVHIAPTSLDATRREITLMDGAEIHAEAKEGLLVVVVEDTAAELASDHIMAIHQLPGVLSLTLSYHYFEATPT